MRKAWLAISWLSLSRKFGSDLLDRARGSGYRMGYIAQAMYDSCATFLGPLPSSEPNMPIRFSIERSPSS